MIEPGVERREGQMVFTVCDNGIGIDPAYRARVFDLFVRLDPSVEGKVAVSAGDTSRSRSSRDERRAWLRPATSIRSSADPSKS